MERRSSSGSERGRARGRSMQSEERRPGAEGGDRMRKRKEMQDLLVTRPAGLPTKVGVLDDHSTKTNLMANYFALTKIPDWTIHMYMVDFDPPEADARLKKRMFNEHKSTLGGFLYDGTNCYSPKLICPKEQPRELCCMRSTDGEKITITVRYLKSLPSTDKQCLTILNIIMKRILSILKLQQVGRDYFDPKAIVPVRGQDFQVWPGYSTSIKQHQDNLLLCVEIAHRVIRKDTALDVWRQLCEDNKYSTESELQIAYKKMMVGKTVMTHYNNATYRIDDVKFDCTPSSTFDQKGTPVTYKDYYYKRYNMKIRDLNQPMLVHTSTKRDGSTQLVLLVPELCTMTGLSDKQRGNFNLMRSLHDYTRLEPQQRVLRLMDFHKKVNENAEVKEEMGRWSLSLSNELVKFPGRIINGQKICGGSNRVSGHRDPADWTDMFRQGLSLYRPVNLKRWLAIIPNSMRNDATNCLSTMKRTGEKMAMMWERSDIEYIENDKQSSYTSLLEKMISRKNYSFIVCFVTNNNQDRYAAIKRKLCYDHAIPNQVITRKAASKNNMSIATKISVQINCKLGGAPWILPMQQAGTMIVGYDVSHGYGAMVSIIDAQGTKYHSTIYAHDSINQLSDYIGQQMTKAIFSYNKYNNCLPNCIMLYRDGVSNGQIPHVYETELKSIKNAIAQFYKDPKACKFTFIIVNKRGGTRLFAENRNQISNPAPGTVADTVITLPERYDFFLVSQSVRNGSVSPTSYNVIYDTSGLKPEKIQLLTYRLTHMYYNWSGTVKVPAPVQYAHKLVALCGQHIKSPIKSSEMDNSLYFL